jgi:serine/threonine protein kinase
MWSLGVVTLCLLTGDALITFDALRKMSQSDIATILANANDEHPKWRDLNVYGQDFVRRLLVLDPENRMTSRSAIKHDWFTKPARVAVELDKLYERANIFWPKRRHSVGIVEDLPDLTWAEDPDPPTHKNGVQLPSQTRRKIPDATASRYFGLERHLHSPGAPSKSTLHLNRKRVLEALKEADAPFIDNISQSGGASIALTTNAKLPPAHRGKSASMAQLKETMGTTILSNGPQMSMSRKRTMELGETYIKTEDLSNLPRANKTRRLNSRSHGGLVIKEVNGNDLFGTPIEIKAAQAAEAASDEMSPYDPFLDETFFDEHFEDEDIPSLDEPSPNFHQSLLESGLSGDAVRRPEMPISPSFPQEEIADEVRKRPKE